MEYFTEEDDTEEEAETVSSEPITPVMTGSAFPPKQAKVGHTRRIQLPSPRLETGPGLLSLLRKHIGESSAGVREIFTSYKLSSRRLHLKATIG